MTIENDIFKRYIPDFKKLVEYGFSKNKTVYRYEKLFKNNEFKAIVEISKEGIITGKVIELENNEEFLPLKVETQQGAFVGAIREEYKSILADIRDDCFLKNYFIFPQSNRITDLIIKKYGNIPNFMWEKFPNFGVFKNADNNKWYGIIMNIDYSKLGKNNNNPVEVINVKLDKNEIQELLKNDGFYPAWHMNKKSWITITLDEVISDSEIMNLIEESYSYTRKSF
jgi:predicted DNA-binding protein (MmcQ/YjbR family)